MADQSEVLRSSPAKKCRLSSPVNTSPVPQGSQQLSDDPVRLASCDIFNTGDSGFSELTSACSEDEHLINNFHTTHDVGGLPLEEHEEMVPTQREEEDDDCSSQTSDVSHISGLSDLSNHDWEPSSGTMTWVQQQMMQGKNPRSILTELVPDDTQIPIHLDDVTLWKIIVNIVSEPPRRERLRHINSVTDAVRLLRSCQKILVLTGAGVSVSCGIPDFRSRDGVYARLAVDFPDLPDPQAMFDIHYFRKDPRPFFKFARDLWPGQFTPSKCHKFIRLLEKHNKLLRNYTQNIDTLEQGAGIERVIQCHGSFATATCLRCANRVPAAAIEREIMEQRIPLCSTCCPPSCAAEAAAALSAHFGGSSFLSNPSTSSVTHPIMKPDIVFFGEGMPDEFHRSMAQDKEDCDLIIVIGSSLKVRPVALIPCALPNHVPQILINREPLRHMVFDVELLGDCDIIVNQLCNLLGSQWAEDICYREPLKEITRLPPRPALPPLAAFGDVLSSSLSRSPSLPKKFHDDPMRRDSGMSTGSSEMESSDGPYNESCAQETSSLPAGTSSNTHDMAGWWEPRVKANLADQLPENSYLNVQPGRYVFPGAEVFYDPDEESDSSDSDSSSDSSGVGETLVEQGTKRKALD